MDEPNNNESTEADIPSGFGTLITTRAGRVLAASANAKALVDVLIDDAEGGALVDMCARGDRDRVARWLVRPGGSPPAVLRFNGVTRAGGLVRCRAMRMSESDDDAVVVEVAAARSPGWTDIDASLADSQLRLEQLEAANHELADGLTASAGDAQRVASEVEALDHVLLEAEASDRFIGQPISADVLLSLGRVSEAVEQLVLSSGVDRSAPDDAEAERAGPRAIDRAATAELLP